MGAFSTEQTAAVLDRVGSAVAWLQSLGIRAPVTRYARYVRDLRSFAEMPPSQQMDTLQTSAQRALYNAFLEVWELIAIHRTLSSTDLRDVQRRLVILSGGPSRYSEEFHTTSSSKARNFAFELAMMARIAHANLPLLDCTDSDAATYILGRTVLVQCKRPFTVASINRRTADAVTQLEASFSARARTRLRGLVALELTRAMNPDGKLSIYESRETLDWLLNERLVRFAKTHTPWRFLGRDHRVFGLFLRYREVALVPSSHYLDPHVCDVALVLPHPSASPEGHRLARELSLRLESPIVA